MHFNKVFIKCVRILCKVRQYLCPSHIIRPSTLLMVLKILQAEWKPVSRTSKSGLKVPFVALKTLSARPETQIVSMYGRA